MRTLLKFVSIVASFGVIGISYAAPPPPESLPAGGQVACVMNGDGTGTVSVTGAQVVNFEVYHHPPCEVVQARSVLAGPGPYKLPACATFNFQFKGRGGNAFMLVDDGELAQVAKIFNTAAAVSAASPLVGVSVIPDKQAGGIGGPGASMTCTGMLRSTIR
ncbi:MAG: hypothetical protein WAV46_04615 [Candidatus Moraniibacteriota bacterium]